MRSYGDETMNFYRKKVPEGGSNFICWPAILIDFIFKKDENYHPQVFLKECCKYIEKEKVKRKRESAKLRAVRARLPYVPRAPRTSCPTCSCVSHASCSLCGLVPCAL